MSGQIILLNGPSSSGKSALAAALQILIEDKRGERFAVVSIDDFLKMSVDDVIYEDDVFEISRELGEAVTAALETAPGVIVDHVITSERIYSSLTEACGDAVLKKVLVTCATEILRQREAARGDRCAGSAEASAQYLYPKDGYDLTVDSGRDSPEALAGRILEILREADEGPKQ